MGWIWRIFLISIVATLQLTLAEYISIKGVKPDLILITILFFSLIKGPIEGESLGFLGGLLEDIFSHGALGINALSKTAIGFFGGYISQVLYFEHIPSQLLIFASATVVNGVIVTLIRIALYSNPSIDLWLILLMVPYNTILALLIYQFLKRFLNLKVGKPRWNL
jgi:rod shape-determining protein MreD